MTAKQRQIDDIWHHLHYICVILIHWTRGTMKIQAIINGVWFWYCHMLMLYRVLRCNHANILAMPNSDICTGFSWSVTHPTKFAYKPSVCNNTGWTRDAKCFKDVTDAFKNAWTSMAYKKKKSKGNYNSKSKILIQNIVSSMKGLCYLLTTILLPLKNPPHALIQGFFHKSLKRRTPNIGPSPLSVVVRDRLTGFQDWCTLICLNYKVPEQ